MDQKSKLKCVFFAKVALDEVDGGKMSIPRGSSAIIFIAVNEMVLELRMVLIKNFLYILWVPLMERVVCHYQILLDVIFKVDLLSQYRNYGLEPFPRVKHVKLINQFSIVFGLRQKVVMDMSDVCCALVLLSFLIDHFRGNSDRDCNKRVGIQISL